MEWLVWELQLRVTGHAAPHVPCRCGVLVVDRASRAGVGVALPGGVDMSDDVVRRRALSVRAVRQCGCERLAVPVWMGALLASVRCLRTLL